MHDDSLEDSYFRSEAPTILTGTVAAIILYQPPLMWSTPTPLSPQAAVSTQNSAIGVAGWFEVCDWNEKCLPEGNTYTYILTKLARFTSLAKFPQHEIDRCRQLRVPSEGGGIRRVGFTVRAQTSTLFKEWIDGVIMYILLWFDVAGLDKRTHEREDVGD